MFCKNCGKEIYESSGICPYCGVNLAQGTGKDMQSYQKKPEKNKNRTLIIVSIVCVLLVIITVAVIAFLMGQKSNEEDDDFDDDDKKTEEVVEEVTTVTTIPFDEDVLEITEPEELTTIIPKEDGRFRIPAKVVRKTDNGTITYEYNEANVTKVSLHVAAINDSFMRGDSFYLSSKPVTYEKIDNIITNESYAKLIYNDYQEIRFDDDKVKFTEVLIAFTGEYKDTLIFSLNGTYVGSYDVEKGEQNAKGISDRVYSVIAN